MIAVYVAVLILALAAAVALYGWAVDQDRHDQERFARRLEQGHRGAA